MFTILWIIYTFANLQVHNTMDFVYQSWMSTILWITLIIHMSIILWIIYIFLMFTILWIILIFPYVHNTMNHIYISHVHSAMNHVYQLNIHNTMNHSRVFTQFLCSLICETFQTCLKRHHSLLLVNLHMSLAIHVHNHMWIIQLSFSLTKEYGWLTFIRLGDLLSVLLSGSLLATFTNSYNRITIPLTYILHAMGFQPIWPITIP